MTRMTARDRAAVARAREYVQDRQDEQRVVAHMQRSKEMTTKKTAQGDRVPKFPDTAGLLDDVAALRSELTELYDLAAEMADRAERMVQASRAANERRFPALGKD